MQNFFLHYCLTELLAAKTLRSIYLAYPLREMQHKFIVKIFDKECAGQDYEEGAVRAKMLLALDHPHIVPMVDIALEEQGRPYVISEYRVHGSLRQRLERLSLEQMDWQEAISIVIQVGQALSYAHSQNVIHGNMKPENIFYDDIGEVQLTDFSLAPFVDITRLEYESDLRTTRYMAPEQFTGKTDQQSDQYALSCLAYELVTGDPPFEAQSFSLMWGKHATEFAAPLSIHVPKIPMSIELAILNALAKKPESRYVDIAAFLAALETGLTSHTSGLPLSLVSSTVTNISGNTPLPSTIVDPDPFTSEAADPDPFTSETQEMPLIETAENPLPAPAVDLSQSPSGVPKNPTDPMSYADLSAAADAFLTEKKQDDTIGTRPIPKLPTLAGIRLHVESRQHQLAPEIDPDSQFRDPADQATDIFQVGPGYFNTDSRIFNADEPTEIQDKVPKQPKLDLLSDDQMPTSVYAPLPQSSKQRNSLKVWISVIAVIIILTGFLLPYFLSQVPNHSAVNEKQNNNGVTKDAASHSTNTARTTTSDLQTETQSKLTATKVPGQTSTIISTGSTSKNPVILPTSVQITPIVPPPTDAPTATPGPHGTGSIRIDAGGTGVGSFIADQDYVSLDAGRPSSASNVSDPIDTSGVSNPASQSVYQSARVGDALYTIPHLTPNAPYNIRLHFAETYWAQAGIRIFNVTINGRQVLSNFDIFIAAGAKDKAVVEQFTITPTSQGIISIQLNTVRDNAQINGIEILAI